MKTPKPDVRTVCYPGGTIRLGLWNCAKQKWESSWDDLVKQQVVYNPDAVSPFEQLKPKLFVHPGYELRTYGEQQ